jgi:hypothetical protein
MQACALPERQTSEAARDGKAYPYLPHALEHRQVRSVRRIGVPGERVGDTEKHRHQKQSNTDTGNQVEKQVPDCEAAR